MARLDPTSPTVLGGALATVGITLLVVGGGLRRGALDMLPGQDGALVGSVVALLLLLAHGHSYRFAVIAGAPILAVTATGFFVGHSRPLAALGLQLAVWGAVGIGSALLVGTGQARPAVGASAAGEPAANDRLEDGHRGVQPVLGLIEDQR